MTIPVRPPLVYPKWLTHHIFQDISITSHSGWMKSVLRVLGQEDHDIPTGGTYWQYQRTSHWMIEAVFRTCCGCREGDCAVELDRDWERCRDRDNVK